MSTQPTFEVTTLVDTRGNSHKFYRTFKADDLSVPSFIQYGGLKAAYGGGRLEVRGPIYIDTKLAEKARKGYTRVDRRSWTAPSHLDIYGLAYEFDSRHPRMGDGSPDGDLDELDQLLNDHERPLSGLLLQAQGALERVATSIDDGAVAYGEVRLQVESVEKDLTEIRSYLDLIESVLTAKTSA